MLEDLYRTGPGKPLAYETLAHLQRDGARIDLLRRNLEGKGLKTLVLDGRETSIYSGALYVYDERALAALLAARLHVLQSAGWPAEPEDFIRRAAREWAPEKTILFDLVADAFGDREHPGRTDVSVPDRDPRYQPRYLEMLREKERAMAGAEQEPGLRF